ncbi:MAG: GntR family transcriptional regulator [Erysipelotrichaceae bacterium]
MTLKHKIVSNLIESDIINGLYKEGGKLPTEEELIEQYQVSRNTLRKAIDTLTRKGYVMPIQGSGLFIRRSNFEGCITLDNFRGLTQDIAHDQLESIVLEFSETQADEAIAEKLHCAIGTPIYIIVRLRIVNGIPYVVEYSWYNGLLVPGLNQDIARASIYQYVSAALNKEIGFVDRMIRADKLSAKDATLLGLEEGDPALISINTSMLKNGKVFDYSIDIHNFKETTFLKLSNPI